MSHRQIIFKIDEGEIAEVLIRASMDKTFQKLFHEACRAAKRNPNNTLHGIKAIVFGSFWMEASCNDMLRALLDLETKSEDTAKVLWTKLKIIPVLEKIDILCRLFPDLILDNYGDLRKRMKHLTDLRNRLAHFKDEPEDAIPVKTDIIDSPQFNIDLLTDVFDIPALSKALMWNAVQPHTQTVLDVHKFLASIKEHLRKKHKLPKQISGCTLRAKFAKRNSK